MPKKTPWKPTTIDLAWTHNLVRIVKDGGVWAFRDGTPAYRLWSSKKLAVLIRGNPESEDCIRTEACLLALGWVVECEVN